MEVVLQDGWLAEAFEDIETEERYKKLLTEEISLNLKLKKVEELLEEYKQKMIDRGLYLWKNIDTTILE